MQIRKTTMEDLQAVMGLYEKARQFMQENGNPGQWGTNHPPREMIVQDIAAGHSYVCTAEGEIAAVFYFAVEPEPDYLAIYEGNWIKDGPYGVVHRITAPMGVKGAAGFCLDWCFRESGGNIRIDTHRENIPMQHLLEKHGYSRCGIIYLQDGAERIAYQKT
ncbi:MAG: GNAT family N-acetyltransferase [Lachnospiraceae bacterium]